MANLYLTEQQSILRKTGDRLLVEKDGERLLDVRCHELETVLIFGNVQFTTQAVHELLEHGIELAIFTRSGKLIGQLTPPMPKNVLLRMAQYELYHDPEFVLTFSRAVVGAKIQGCLENVRAFSYNHKEIDLAAQIASLERSLASLPDKNSPEELLGSEGSAAAVYFTAFGKMLLNPDFSFPGRRKHPAPDPVNALLSFGYTLLLNEINSLLDGIGFDPYIGFYHKVDYGRPSLACDLVEEFRGPVIDRFTLTLLNKRVFKPEDFSLHAPSGGMHLAPAALKVYFARYEKHMRTEVNHPELDGAANYRKALRYQAHKLATSLTHKKEYRPLLFPGQPL